MVKVCKTFQGHSIFKLDLLRVRLDLSRPKEQARGGVKTVAVFRNQTNILEAHPSKLWFKALGWELASDSDRIHSFIYGVLPVDQTSHRHIPHGILSFQKNAQHSEVNIIIPILQRRKLNDRLYNFLHPDKFSRFWVFLIVSWPMEENFALGSQQT